MSLVGYQPETRVIPLSREGSFEVKGLSLNDFTTLVNKHLPDLEAIVEIGMAVMNGRTDIEADDITRIAMSLCEQAPGFVSNLIALASGEEDREAAITAAGKLTFPTQILALSDIAELTFSEVGGIKKALALVAERLSRNDVKLPKSLKKVL